MNSIRFLRYFAALLCCETIIFCNVAFASSASPRVELSILGPAGSWHASSKDAPYNHQTRRRQWQQNNPAIGLQWSMRAGESSPNGLQDTYKLSATLVTDSYGRDGGFVSLSRQRLVGNFGSVRVEAGAAAGLWYRGWATEKEISMRLTPFIVPLLTFQESHSAMGVNVSFLPKLSYNGQSIVPTTTVMLQTLWKIPL